MGMRSQMYVRTEVNENTPYYGEKMLIASYFQWNYGERMIARAAYTAELIASHEGQIALQQEKIENHLKYNHDLNDNQITMPLIDEYLAYDHDFKNGYNAERFYNDVFISDNNDGRCLLWVDENKTELKKPSIKFAFLDSENEKIMTAEEYLNWDLHTDNWAEKLKNDCITYDEMTEAEADKAVEQVKSNIEMLGNYATLMTKEEVEKFLHDDYSDVVNKRIEQLKTSPWISRVETIKSKVRQQEEENERKQPSAKKSKPVERD